MMGGIGLLWKFRIAKILISKIATILKFFKSHLLQTESLVQLKLDGMLRGDMEIQTC